MTAAQHAATGFSLAAPHRDVACEACHGQAPAPWAERFPGRAPGACRSCHDDVHQGQFDPQRYAQCTDCHHRTHFVPPAFSFPDHERSGFPLRGAHQAVGCAGCHDEVRDGVRRFDGAARECASCHDDVHRGAFDEHAPRRVDGRTGCARCHDESGFSGERTAFDHGWTGYPLQHAHQQVKCEQCHPRGSVPDQDGRHFRRRSRACAGCHDDPHLGQFAAAGPAGPQVDCARCHTERSFAQTRFDHDRDARFQLGASHRDVACDRCHRPVATAAGPVVRYRPLGRECGDCHVLGDAGEVRR